jgi:hypothetical protein
MKKTIYSNAIEQIDILFDHVITNSASDFLRVDIGMICPSLATEIYAQTELLLENYIVSIDSFCLRHITNQHGSKKEELRGQVKVKKSDLRLLPKVIEFADKIYTRGKTTIGKDCIIAEKTIGNLYFFSVWEIRVIKSIKKDKKSRIMLQTFYIRKLKK